MSNKTPPITVSQQQDVWIVEFTDSKIIDEANIKDIGDQLLELIGAHNSPCLLLDFASVDHLSSAALGMLINVNNRIRQQNGKLRLTNIKPHIFEIFVITKLNKLFRILPTRAIAAASFKQ